MASSTHCDHENDDNNLDSEMVRKHEEWMAEYGRIYKDEAEKARRFEIFEQNVKYIEDFNNSGEHKCTLSVNLFADLTNEEFGATYTSGLKIPEEEQKDSLNTSCPSSIDQMIEGAETDMKHQGATCENTETTQGKDSEKVKGRKEENKVA